MDRLFFDKPRKEKIVDQDELDPLTKIAVVVIILYFWWDLGLGSRYSHTPPNGPIGKFLESIFDAGLWGVYDFLSAFA